MSGSPSLALKTLMGGAASKTICPAVPKPSAAWSKSDLRQRNKMAKKRRGRFSLKEERQLIQMAATSATMEEAAAILRTSVDTIEKKSQRLGIEFKRVVELGLKAKGK